MKLKMLKKGLLCFAMTTAVAVLSACGGGDSNTGTDGTTNPPQDARESEETGSNGDGAETGIIEEYGLFWSIEDEAYLMEDAVLSGQESLVVWLDNPLFGEAVVAGFQEKYPDVRVEFQEVESVETVAQMALAGEAGIGADVFILVHDHMATAFNSSVVGMMGRHDEAIRRRFAEPSIGTVDINGQLWGIPILTETIALFYNQTLLDELYAEGVIDSPEPATDFQQIIDLAQTYNNPASNTWTLRFQAGDSYINHMFLTAFGFELFGPDGTNPDMIGFDQPATVQGLEFFSSLRPIWNVNATDVDWDATTMAFAEGETPYLIMGPWGIEEVRNGAEINGFEFGVTTIPLMNGNQPYTFSGNQVIAVSPYSNNPAAARELAMYIASDEILTFVFENLGKLPALNSDYAGNIPGLMEDEIIAGFIEQAAFTVPMPSIAEVDFFWASAEVMWRSVWDGIVTPENAAQEAYTNFNNLRAVAG